MGGDLGAGVARAHHDEGRAGLLLGRVLGQLGQLDLADHVVVQVDRLGQASETMGILGHPGDRQQLVDAADREHQPVVRQLTPLPLRVGEADPAVGQVDPVGLADDHPYPGQGAGQRHRDPAGLDHPGGHLGQQRQVEEVVGRVQQHDLGTPAGQPTQRLRRVVTGETGPTITTRGFVMSAPFPAVSATNVSDRPGTATPERGGRATRHPGAGRPSDPPTPERGGARRSGVTGRPAATGPTPTRTRAVHEGVVGRLIPQ